MNFLRWVLPRIQVPVLGGLLLLLLLGTSGAQEPPTKDDAAAEVRRMQLVEANRLAGQARQFQQAGKLAEAILALEGVLAIAREVFGAVHEECSGTLEWLAFLEEGRGDHAAARRRLEVALEIQTKLHGAEHWRATDARRALGDLNRREKLTPEERGQLREAQVLTSRVFNLWRAGKHDQAIPLAGKALAIRRRILGEEHPDTALSLFNLAAQHKALGRYAEAELLYRQALEIWRVALGEGHPGYTTSLNTLAGLYESMAEYAKAEPLYRQALKIRKKGGIQFTQAHTRCCRSAQS